MFAKFVLKGNEIYLNETTAAVQEIQPHSSASTLA